MRMRDQLIVIIAVSIATIAVAGNVFAHTRAADQRAEIERAGRAAEWSRPARDATTTTQPAASDSGPASRQVEEEGGTDSTDPADTPEGAAISCSRRSQCASEEEPSRSFMNHGRMVSGYVHALGFEEGVDGPRGAYISQIARPDIDNDGPPRSERAEENQGTKDVTTPPGQDKKDVTTPPGQDKKDEDG